MSLDAVRVLDTLASSSVPVNPSVCVFAALVIVIFVSFTNVCAGPDCPPNEKMPIWDVRATVPELSGNAIVLTPVGLAVSVIFVPSTKPPSKTRAFNPRSTAPLKFTVPTDVKPPKVGDAVVLKSCGVAIEWSFKTDVIVTPFVEENVCAGPVWPPIEAIVAVQL
jgi:hypothetical protein